MASWMGWCTHPVLARGLTIAKPLAKSRAGVGAGQVALQGGSNPLPRPARRGATGESPFWQPGQKRKPRLAGSGAWVQGWNGEPVGYTRALEVPGAPLH